MITVQQGNCFHRKGSFCYRKKKPKQNILQNQNDKKLKSKTVEAKTTTTTTRDSNPRSVTY